MERVYAGIIHQRQKQAETMIQHSNCIQLKKLKKKEYKLKRRTFSIYYGLHWS